MNTRHFTFISLLVLGLFYSTMVQASTTQLGKVAKVIDHSQTLVHSVISSQPGLAQKHPIVINTSYVLNQGLNIVIQPLKLKAPDQTTKQTAKPIAAKQHQAYWQQSKAMAHHARDLTIQLRSLKLSISEAQPEQKAQLIARSQQIQTKLKALERQRQDHKNARPTDKAVSKAATRTPADSQRHQFYSRLILTLAEQLCHSDIDLKAIAPKEQLSITYQQGGDKKHNRHLTKGWSIELSSLNQCQQGKLSASALQQQANIYQY